MEASRTDGVWATVPDGVDGICRDAEGAVRAEVAQRIHLTGSASRAHSAAPTVAGEWNGYENIGTGPRTSRSDTTEVIVPALRR
ncbi:MAG: hypothetical protein QOG44_991 [Acidimicrobiaceae bacterium]|jgi:hypothetical protein|nr:hypothetical protein [Acidimicrobiaceae bacterium]MDQ1365574.1 hypothetical protein [Acidimicrobiaceae bacterium]